MTRENRGIDDKECFTPSPSGDGHIRFTRRGIKATGLAFGPDGYLYRREREAPGCGISPAGRYRYFATAR
jgi:hypothetical protein